MTRNGELLSVPAKAVEILIALIENRGSTVARDQIIERIWPDTFVDQNNLAVMISVLRKTLGESRGRPQFIETVPRRGYRFIHPVDEISNNDPSADRDDQRDVASGRRFYESRRFQLGFLGILALVLIAGAVFMTRPTPNADAAAFRPNYSLPTVSAPRKSFLILPFAEKNTNDRRIGSEISLGLISRIGRLDYFHMRPLADIIRPADRKRLQLAPIVEKADFVVDGVIEMSQGGILIVRAELFDVRRQETIWRGESSGGNPIAISDELAMAIVDRTLNSLDDAQRVELAQRRPISLAAYSTYLLGVKKFRRREFSETFFEDAIRLDPEFSGAYAMLAINNGFSGWAGTSRNAIAKNLLKKAFELDPHSADAFAAQGFIQVFHEFDWDGGERSLRMALEIDPHHIEARHWLAYLFAIQRRLDDAKAELEIALESDPTSATLLTDYAELFYFGYDFERARQINSTALKLEPGHSFALSNASRYDPNVYFYKESQREDVLRDLEIKVSRLDGNSFGLGVINVDPRYDFIRNEPRFQAILKKLRLDMYK